MLLVWLLRSGSAHGTICSTGAFTATLQWGQWCQWGHFHCHHHPKAASSTRDTKAMATLPMGLGM